MAHRLALLCLLVALFAALIVGAGRARANDGSWTSEAPIERTSGDGSRTS